MRYNITFNWAKLHNYDLEVHGFCILGEKKGAFDFMKAVGSEEELSEGGKRSDLDMLQWNQIRCISIMGKVLKKGGTS